jgi:hypothetical protein
MEGIREASDIKSIKSELEAMAPLLTRRPEAEDWMGEARELFYDIDDTVEHLMRYFYLASAREATNPFRDLRAKPREVTKRCRARLETTPEAVFPNRKPAVDPRARFLHKDASELVGMDKQRAKVMKLLQGDEGAADLQPLKMVCIVGFAGTGKTTLADLVYSVPSRGERFQCRAFASLCASSTTSTTDLLKAILRQVAADNIQSAGTEAVKLQTLNTILSTTYQIFLLTRGMQTSLLYRTHISKWLLQTLLDMQVTSTDFAFSFSASNMNR